MKILSNLCTYVVWIYLTQSSEPFYPLLFQMIVADLNKLYQVSKKCNHWMGAIF